MSLPAVKVSHTPEDKFREYLGSRAKPQRFTEQQRDMVQFIFRTHKHFDADQLIDAMKKDGLDVSRATVYRTLAKLVDAGLLRKLDIGPRVCYDHDYGYPQHEHLQCGQCGKMIEFQSAALEQTLREVCQAHQFNPSGHTLIVRGTCGDCNRSRASKRKLDLI